MGLTEWTGLKHEPAPTIGFAWAHTAALCQRKATLQLLSVDISIQVSVTGCLF